MGGTARSFADPSAFSEIDMMKTMDELKKSLTELLVSGQLRKLTLSRPSDPEVIRTEGHLFENKGVVYLQLETFSRDGKAKHRNLVAAEAADAVFADLQAGYGQLNVLSPLGDGEARLSKSGKWLVGGKISNRASSEQGAEQPAGKRNAEEMPMQTGTVLPHDHEKQYLLPEGECYPFLIRLGICAPDGRVLEKKRPKFLQINKFLEQIEAAYRHLPQEGTLHVLDLCCGKSYLTFAAYHYLTVMRGRRVEMLGADRKADVIAYCASLSAKLGYSGLRFVCCDIGELAVQSAPDMVLSLHACDIATDIVLAKAIATGARVVLSTPCCHHQMMAQMSENGGELGKMLAPITEHSLLRQKFCDALTDGLRCKMLEIFGYEVTVAELIDPEQTPKNLLIRAVFRGRLPEKRQNALRAQYDALCALGDLSPALPAFLNAYLAHEPSERTE